MITSRPRASLRPAVPIPLFVQAPIPETIAGLDPRAFLVDLTLVLCVAGVTTVLFQRLRQPVILGYLLAGLILGPRVPIPLSADPRTLALLADLGVVLLMFSVGLDLSVRRLIEVGPSSAFVAVLQLGLMVFLGFTAGRLFGWTLLESLFTGAIVAISSTLLIRKVFSELGVRRDIQETVIGITVFEDLMSIVLLATLAAVAAHGEADVAAIGTTALRLVVFLALSIVVGLLIVPRTIRFVIALRRRETLLVASVGLCFASALFAERQGYSIALGAFLAGSLVAESGHGARVQAVIEPVRDLFAALFFVSMGMLIDPALILEHWPAVLALTAVVVVGKVVGVGIGVFLTGRDLQTALRAGVSMAQIGELSFVVAATAVASGAAGAFLQPVAVAVSSATAFLSPLLIRASEPLASRIDRALPGPLQTWTSLYASWLAEIRARGTKDARWRIVRRSTWVVSVDAALLAIVLIAGALAMRRLSSLLESALGLGDLASRLTVVGAVALAAVVPLLGMLRGARKLGTTLAEMAMPSAPRGRLDSAAAPRRALTATLQLAVFLCAAMPVAAVSEPFLPAFSSPLGLLVIVLALFWGLWRSTENLQGHVRAGAEIIGEALGRESQGPDPRPMELVQEILPGLGEITMLRIDEASPAVGRTLSDLELRGRTGASVVAIDRPQGRVVMPGGNEMLRSGDLVAFTGAPEAIEECERILGVDPRGGDGGAPS